MSNSGAQNGRILPFVPRAALTFGIYHGGVLEPPQELSTGKPDSPEEINRALDMLQGGKHLVVRSYIRFTGAGNDLLLQNIPRVAELAQYTWNGRKLGLVLSNWDSSGNLSNWNTFIERVIDRFGEYLGFVQIGAEPNHYEYPGDGRFGHSVRATFGGVHTAAQVIRRKSLACQVGFNAVPSSFHFDRFWRQLEEFQDSKFLNALDFAGVNLYPDVAEPVLGELGKAVESTLREFRDNLDRAGIPCNIPLHVSEHGWPTGPRRFYSRQAEVLEQVVQKVYDLSAPLNINQFELFALRDADTSNPGQGHQFGILRDNYAPKPAFETYRRLIKTLGR